MSIADLYIGWATEEPGKPLVEIAIGELSILMTRSQTLDFISELAGVLNEAANESKRLEAEMGWTP